MKLKVKDTKGRTFHVTDECHDTDDVKLHDEEFSADEIKKLKKLLPHLDELLQLLEADDDKAADKDFDSDELDSETEEETEEVSEDEVIEDDALEEEIEEDESEEEVKVVHDSKVSFGSLAKKKIVDSYDEEIERNKEIADAWAKRYGGK